MTNGSIHDFSSMPIPYPYLISALDQYYGLIPSVHEEQGCKRVQSNTGGQTRKNLRILITTFWDYPFVGGLQNYIMSLKNALENLGHRVDVIAPNQFPKDQLNSFRKQIGAQNQRFYMNRYGCCNAKILDNSRYLYSYDMILRDYNLNDYDIFHAQDRFTANILGRLNQYYQKPLLFTPHGFMTHRRLKFNQIQKGSVEEAYFLTIDRKAIEYADRVVILCEAFRPILKKLGAEDSKMTTVYTGIDFGMDNIQKQAKTNIDKTVITCISRLRPRKGHKYLFEALALIKHELNNVEVWIIGDGEMRGELENQVRHLQLENVSFLGSRNDIPDLLSQSDIFVLPTTSDTLPISIIEAMFAGQSIITTNCGGIPEIIQNNQSGLITEPGDPQQLAERILLLLRDRSLREKLAQNAKLFAEKRLTVMNMAKEIEQVYQSLL